MRTRLLWVVLPAVIGGCGRTAPFDSSPPPGSSVGGAGGGGVGACKWKPGPLIDVDDAFPGPFNGPAIASNVAVNAWDDAHSLSKGRFVERTFDWHGNAGPTVLLHQFSGPPTWLFNATPQEDKSVMAAWTDPAWTIGAIDTTTGSFDTVATMNPSNDALVDVFRSGDRVFLVSEQWLLPTPHLSAQIIENGVTSPLIDLGPAVAWLGLTREGVLEELIANDSPNAVGGPVTTLVRLDPDATPKVSTVPLNARVLAYSRCPDHSLAFAAVDTQSLDPQSSNPLMQIGRLAADRKTVSPPQVLKKPQALIGGLDRPVGLLCTEDRVFIAWEDARSYQALPEPGTSDGQVIDQLWFTTLEADGTFGEPLMLDQRFDGYDAHPQLSLDGQTVVVTWLKADRGPANHDVLTRIDCADQ